MSSATSRQTSRIFTVSVASALLGGLTTALLEVALTLRRTHHAGNAAELAALLIALYTVTSLALGLLAGGVISALQASGALDLGRSFWSRIRADEEFDRAVAVASLFSRRRVGGAVRGGG